MKKLLEIILITAALTATSTAFAADAGKWPTKPVQVTTRINRTDTLEAPEKVQLTHGAFSGEVNVRIGRVDGAGSYELQVAQADPGVEDNWRHAQSSTVLRVTLRDLNKLQPCWVRARGISGPSAGRWCAPSSIVVL